MRELNYDERVSMTPEAHHVKQLLEREAATGVRHFLWEGRVTEMTGGTGIHQQLCARLVHLFMGQVDDKLETFSEGVRIFVPPANLVYADTCVSARPPKYGNGPRDTLLNPIVVCEVLSRSTEAFDRGEKFAGYRSIRSLDHYVLVSQTSRLIEVFSRAKRWVPETFGPGQRAEFKKLEAALDIDLLYKHVTLPSDS